jgi:hypothetical protein
MPLEAPRAAPVAHHDEDRAQRQELADLDAGVEGDEVGHEPLGRDLEVEDLRREPEAVAEAEREHGGLGVRLHAEPAPERAEVVERLVHDGEPDDGVHDVRARADAQERSEQKRRRVADREQRHVRRDVLHAVQEEDDADEEEEVVVAGDHVLRAEVRERHEQDAGDLLQVALVALGDAVGEGGGGQQDGGEARRKARDPLGREGHATGAYYVS